MNLGKELVEKAHFDGTYDFREPLGEPKLARRVGRKMENRILNHDVYQAVGQGLGAYPLVGAITSSSGEVRGGMVRKTRKGYDRNRMVEGPIDRSEPCVLVEDLANSGRGMRLALKACRKEGLRVVGAQAIAVLNSPESAEQKMRRCGIWFDALYQI